MPYATPRLLLLVICACLGLAGTGRAQSPGAARYTLQNVLRPDGSLLPGARGSFDATGYRLVPGPGGQPRFAAAADAGDENWDDRFGLPGVLYGPVKALAVDAAGNLYVGGYFGSAGGMEAVNVARWDGRRWHALGTGTDGQVNAIATIGTDVYVGGSFTKAGTVQASGVARWDGTRWYALGSGVQTSYGSAGTVHALAAVGGRLYVGGNFEKAGGVDARSLAVWNGAGWAEAGGGVYYAVYSPTSYSLGTVFALTPSGDDLYVGGQFALAGDAPAGGIARLDTRANAWTTFGDGVASGTSLGTVYGVAVRGGDLYVGGTFTRAGGADAANVARYDLGAGAWSAMGLGLTHDYSPAVRSFAFVGDALYAAGSFRYANGEEANYLARWDGGAWAPVLTGDVNGLGTGSADAHVVLAFDDALYVAGDFDTQAGVGVNNVARFDPGTATWTPLGMGINSGTCCGYVSAVATAPNGDVYAGGYFEYAGNADAHSIARWDGTRWHALGTGLQTSSLNGAVHAIAVSGTDVYVGGDFTRAGGRAATNIARWDAATETWHALGSGVNGYVYALAIGPDGALYAGGDFSAAGTTTVDNIARWDGTRWTNLGQGIAFDDAVRALAFMGQVLFVGGDFNRIKPAAFTNFVDAQAFAFWDSAGDAWYTPADGGVWYHGSFGSDYPGDITDIAVVGNEVYVAGDIDRAGNVAAFKIARFNLETGWSALDSNVGGADVEVNALVAHGGDLYVGGRFETAGDLTVNNIARWDGTAWSALGSGLVTDAYSGVNGLAVWGNTLSAGGDFLGAGGVSSHNFAQWTIEGGPAGAAEIAIDPRVSNHGDVAVGESDLRMVTVANAAGATAPLTVTVGAATGPFEVVQGAGTYTLAPGQSLEVLVAFTPAAAGAATGEVRVTHDAPNEASPIVVSLRGNGTAVQPPPPVWLRNFDPDGPALTWPIDQVLPIDSGFVFGPNLYGDRAKAVAFTGAAGKQSAALPISKVRIWFGYKAPGVTNETYTVSLYDGTEATGPVGAPLHTESFRVADIRADADFGTAAEPTELTLSRVVTPAGPFFVVVDFGATASEAGLFTIAASERIARRVPEVWEQWSNGSWYNVSDAWASQTGEPGSGTSGWQPWIEAGSTTATDAEPEAELPATVTLSQNYPNPFNPATRIRFALTGTAHIRLQVFDVQGRLVQTLVDGVQPAGAHDVAFEAGALPSGTYFYRLETPQGTFTRPMVLLR